MQSNKISQSETLRAILLVIVIFGLVRCSARIENNNEKSLIGTTKHFNSPGFELFK